MNWLRQIFGSRTQRAPQSSLPMVALQVGAWHFIDALQKTRGSDIAVGSVVNTNSMLPTLDANALLLLERVPFSALTEGDIVTYRSAAGLSIVHRLNERTHDGNWWPLGDNNGRMDAELVTPDNFDRRVCGILYGAKDATTDS